MRKFAEIEPQQHLLFPGDEALAPSASSAGRQPGADESHWLELHLYECEAGVRPIGREAMLYCGACQASIAYEDVVPGPIRDWPYCPTHQDNALMVCATSLGLQDRRGVPVVHETDQNIRTTPGPEAEEVSSD